MATSGTSTWNLDIDEIIEEAYERAGLGRAFSGADYRTARRSLNLLSQEFANRGINLWTIEDATQALSSGTATYTLPTNTVSILDYAIRTGSSSPQVDTAIARRPQITVWPVPNDNSYTLGYYRVKRIEDSSNGGEYQYDAPTRFLPAIVSGLAYHIALKSPTAVERVPMLKKFYEEEWQLAASEDRERTNFKITPSTGYAW